MSSHIYHAGLKMGAAIASADGGKAAASVDALRDAAASFNSAGQPGFARLTREIASSAPGRSDRIASLFHGQIQPSLDDRPFQTISTGWLMGRAATSLRLVKADPRDKEETKKRFTAAKQYAGEWLRGAKAHYDHLQQVYQVPPTAHGPLTSAISAIDVSKSIGDLNNSAQLVDNAASQIGTAVS